MTLFDKSNGNSNGETNGTDLSQIVAQRGQPLGMVIEGSVSNGVEVRLDPVFRWSR